MKKNELVSFVRQAILGSEPNADNIGKVHYKRVEQAVGYAFDGMLATLYNQGEEGRFEIESYFVKHYKNQVVFEASGYRYVGLDSTMANLPNGKAIWYVQPHGDGKPFIQIGRSNLAQQRNMHYGAAIDEVFWYIGNVTSESKRQIVFETVGNPAFTDIRRIDYGIVRALESYDDTEEVFIPDGLFSTLIQTAATWFGQRPSDNINNNF